jgi:hypothetical protein
VVSNVSRTSPNFDEAAASDEAAAVAAGLSAAALSAGAEEASSVVLELEHPAAVMATRASEPARKRDL